jgi:hypothetical protein
MTPRGPLTEETLDEYRALGVGRLILLQTGRTQDALTEFVEDTARRFF